MGLAEATLLGGATDNEDLFTQANHAFAKGDYAVAIRKYETTAGTKGLSASLLFNLGNAYFRDGKIGPAVLNYERALVLSPHDADIEANLRLARKASGLFVPEPVWWERVTHLLSLDGWAWLASGSLMLSCAGGIMWLRSKRRLCRQTMLLSLLPLSVAVVSLGVLSDFNRAVVLIPETPVRIGPFEDTTNTSTTLAAGEMVRLQDRHENFVFIRAHDGKSGWVSNRQVEPILKY